LYGIASEEGRLMIENYKQLSKNLIPAWPVISYSI
jgi:hypothetical protein